MAKTRKSMLRAINKYNKEKTDEIKIRVIKGNKEIIQAYCKDKKTSVNSLVNELLTERLLSDGYELKTKSTSNE